MVRHIVPDIVSNQDLATLPPSATVRQAARKMASLNVRSILVVQGRTLVGIFTGTDLTCRVVAEGLDPDTTMLSAVMTRDPHTVRARDTAITALNCMQGGGHRHLPVTEGDRLVGVLSRRDFLAHEVDEIERQERIWQEI